MNTLLTLEPGLIIWTILTFTILLFILKKLAWKPMLTMLGNREEAIRSDMRRAEDARAEAEHLLAEHRALQERSEIDARRIIEDARQAGDKLRQGIVDQAHEQARQMTAQAKDEIRREKDTALTQLRDEVADLALMAASRLLGEDMNDERHRALVRDYLTRFPRN